MNTTALLQKVCKIPLFKGLENEDLIHFLEGTRKKVYKPGSIVVREGERGKSLYIILKGRVKVFTRDRKGSEFLLAYLGEGQLFGEMALLSGYPCNATVMTLEDTTLLELIEGELRVAMEKEPHIKELLYRHYALRKEGKFMKLLSKEAVERRTFPRLNERG